MTYVPAAHPGPGLRLHLNENTAGPSPLVRDAVRSLTTSDLAEYPDYTAILAGVERWFGVAVGWVLLTNGLDEGIDLAARLAGISSHGLFDGLIVEPAFEMYASRIVAAGGHVVAVPALPDLGFPLPQVLSAVAENTRVIYLCDPNNPTGLPIPAGAIARIAEAAPHALVFVDEAYGDFSGRTTIGPLLSQHRNLVVGRTFAKAHGLAALRVGALVGHPETLAPLRRLALPYNLNIAAVAGLGAALRDRDYLDWYVAQAEASRQLIVEFCRARSLTCWPSEANFCLVRIGDCSTDLVTFLTERGVCVRDRSGTPGCDGCVRITAGVVTHTRRCLFLMGEWYASRAR